MGASQVALLVENLPADAGDVRDAGSIRGSGRSPGREHGNPLEKIMDRGAWWAIVQRVTKSRTTLKQLSMNAHKQVEFLDVSFRLTPKGVWLDSQSCVLASVPLSHGGLFLSTQLGLPSPVCQEQGIQ